MKIGYSEKIHLPKERVFLSGYPREEKTGKVHIPPKIASLTVCIEEKMICFCVIDTLMISSEMLHWVRQCVSAQTDLEYENIHLCATHTHSAPCIHKMNMPDPPVNEQWKKKTWECCAEMIVQSTKELIECECYFNDILIDGLYGNRNDIHGDENKHVYIYSFLHENRLIGRFLNISCHNTINSTDNVISTDLFGGIRRHIETEHEFCMITNGISGDISTRYYRKGTDCQEIDRISEIMAKDIKRAELGQKIQMDHLYTYQIFSHAFQDMKKNEMLSRRILELEEKKHNNKMEIWDDFELESFQMHMQIRIFYHLLESTVFICSNRVWITLPGEAVTYFDSYFRSRFPSLEIVFLGTCDGYAGYFVPDQQVSDFEEEMAEVTSAHVWKHMHRIEAVINSHISAICGNL